MTLERHIWTILFSQNDNNNKSVENVWRLQNYKKLYIPIFLLKWLLEFQVKKSDSIIRVLENCTNKTVQNLIHISKTLNKSRLSITSSIINTKFWPYCEIGRFNKASLYLHSRTAYCFSVFVFINLRALLYYIYHTGQFTKSNWIYYHLYQVTHEDR